MAGHSSKRKDHHASAGGGKFGKSGGGKGGMHSKLISSPMSPKMPAVGKAMSHGK